MCATVACDGEPPIEITLTGDCCPSCVAKPDCSSVPCASLSETVCREGYKAIETETDCCPICVPEICDDDEDPGDPNESGVAQLRVMIGLGYIIGLIA